MSSGDDLRAHLIKGDWFGVWTVSIKPSPTSKNVDANAIGTFHLMVMANGKGNKLGFPK